MAKAGNGEGTIYQRASDGQFVTSVSFGTGADGKRKRTTLYGKTREEVAEKRTDLLTMRKNGLTPPKSITIEVVISQWLEATQPTVRYKTYRTYEMLSRNHIIPGLGYRKLQELSIEDVRVFLQGKISAGELSRSTIQRIHATLKTALAYAMRCEYVHRNVAAICETPRGGIKKKAVPIASFTTETAQRLLEAFLSHDNKLGAGPTFGNLFALLFLFGLRVGEGMGLEWRHIKRDSSGRVVGIHIEQQLQNETGRGNVLIPPKSESGIRFIPVPENDTIVQEIFRRQREWQEAHREGFTSPSKADLVFTTSTGSPLLYRNANREFGKIMLRLEIEGMTLHTLRHFFTSLVSALGVSDNTLIGVTGHSDSRFAKNTYGHAIQHEMQKAMTGAHKVFNKEEKEG
jgi:integrase